MGGGGGTASRGTLGYWKGYLKNFPPEILATGGGGGGGAEEEKFSRRTIPKLHVFDQIIFKNLQISKHKFS
jgi:hypothetical protein